MNLERIEEIVTLFNEYPVSEISIEGEEGRLFIRKEAGLQNLSAIVAGDILEAVTVEQSAQIEPESETPSAPDYTLLNARMVGIFHHAKPPIGYGAVISVGQLVGHIETMKLMNEVIAEEAGKVVEVLAEEGAPAEYGQPLFRLSAG